ncbi:LysR family transcriptional regulator [Pseudoduganella albidiflava]|uniref:LysR family transcriptional regulator n=1 Tax=Pseudoduganella albidiflava TaxID=321983 RepID=A0A411WTG3_9BURK|nr:LysR family transcriptional regulator [Pseudoduganella albidiflava]QBI00081.1 LysR family transcriptional regulator [Pseudoduganella albidiflava]GGY63852.1 LysR family transcriptional regulator [Pseudoduganella albidiflava]
MARRFDHLADVEALLSVVEHGSLTNAAVVLATTPSVLSRAIARLEARLGTQLLRRTTRSQSLTDAGRLYVDETRRAFGLVEQAERTIACCAGQEESLVGRVRLSVPTSYGHHRLPPLLAAFARRHPQVQVELNITNRNVDLAAEGYDMAIRSGPLPDSSMVARPLEAGAMILVAAPDYVRTAGPLATFDDLQRQRCIGFVRPSTGRVIPWLLRVDGRDVDWVPPPGITVSDDVVGVVTLAAQGLGIAICADFMAAADIAAGRLVQVLPALCGRMRAFSLVYAPHRGLSLAARALIDVLVEHASERPGPAAQRPPASPA